MRTVSRGLQTQMLMHRHKFRVVMQKPMVMLDAECPDSNVDRFASKIEFQMIGMACMTFPAWQSCGLPEARQVTVAA